MQLPKSTLDALPKSVLGKNQGVEYHHQWADGQGWHSMRVTLLYGHKTFGGGRNTLSISADMHCDGTPDRKGFRPKDIAEQFPELDKYLKWNMFTSCGPNCYPGASLYCAGKSDLRNARILAIWPDASLSDFTAQKLLDRLPALMLDFKSDMESLGFTY